MGVQQCGISRTLCEDGCKEYCKRVTHLMDDRCRRRPRDEPGQLVLGKSDDFEHGWFCHQCLKEGHRGATTDALEDPDGTPQVSCDACEMYDSRESNEVVNPPSDPVGVARTLRWLWLAPDEVTTDRVRFWRGSFWGIDDAAGDDTNHVWKELRSSYVEGLVFSELEHACYVNVDKLSGGVRKSSHLWWNPNIARVNRVVTALRTVLLTDDSVESRCLHMV